MAEFDFAGLRRFLASRDLQVIVASRDGPTSDWRPRRLEVTGQLAADLRQIALRAIDKLAKRQERSYVEGWTPDPHTYSLAAAGEALGPLSDALLGSYSADLEHDTATDLIEATTGDDEEDSLRGRVLGLVGRGAGDDLLIVRAQNPVIEMSRDRLTAIIRGRRLSEARRLFTYDGRIDVLVWNRQAVVVNATVLESLMRDPARLETELASAVAAFEASHLFASTDALRATAADDTNFARGVRRVHKSGYLQGLRLERLSDAIASWGHDKVRVTAEKRIAFDPSSRWDFLRLIDDGYLTSDLTGLRYEVNSKRRWSRFQVTAAKKDKHGRVKRLHGLGAWSPRRIEDVIEDLGLRRAEYFLVGPAGPELLTLRVTAADPEVWAGSIGSEHNVLLDLPEPE